MSINDLLNDDTLLTDMASYIVIMLIVAFPIAMIMIKKVNQNIYGDDKYQIVNEAQNAKVLARRVSPHPLYRGTVINMVVFELSNGNRLELIIKDSNKYRTIVEGDCGFLQYRGKSLIKFERNP